MGPAPFVAHAVGAGLTAVYRELVAAEARLAAAGASFQGRVSVADHFPVLQDYLDLYARHLSPAGVAVFAGGLDDGSRFTGVPFHGPRAALERLGLNARGSGSSPAEAPFWEAVALASPVAAPIPLESLFGTLHLAHARPFDLPQSREVREESARHVLRVLEETRPQAAVAVGADALDVLARALSDARVHDLAAIPEDVWCGHWPAGTPLLRYPYVEVPVARPFRMRLVPVPALDGPHGDLAVSALGGVLAYAWSG